MANSLGVMMIMYTCAGIGLTWLRGTDDSVNTVAAAATSATIFRSPGMERGSCAYTYRELCLFTNGATCVSISAGIRKAGIAGALAAGVAVMYCAWNNGGLSMHRMNGWKHAA